MVVVVVVVFGTRVSETLGDCGGEPEAQNRSPTKNST